MDHLARRRSRPPCSSGASLNKHSAYFRQEDAAVTLYREWSQYQKQPLYFSDRDSWDSMLQQGIQLLERFSQEDRVQIRQPRCNLQIKFVRPLTGGNNDFVAYVDAIGKLDGSPCLLEWKTTSSRYPEEPEGLLALDPQLVCYSWITGIHDVAEVVFVRKRLVEIQYLRTTITHEQRNEFAQLVQDTIRQIESARFLPHRFDPPEWLFTEEYPPSKYKAESARWKKMGATILGGCCGTTPEHIRQLSALR